MKQPDGFLGGRVQTGYTITMRLRWAVLSVALGDGDGFCMTTLVAYEQTRAGRRRR